MRSSSVASSVNRALYVQFKWFLKKYMIEGLADVCASGALRCAFAAVHYCILLNGVVTNHFGSSERNT